MTIRNFFLEFIEFLEQQGFCFELDFCDAEGIGFLFNKALNLHMKLVWSENITSTERQFVYVSIWLKNRDDTIVAEAISLLDPLSYKSCGVNHIWQEHLSNMINNVKQDFVLHRLNDPRTLKRRRTIQ